MTAGALDQELILQERVVSSRSDEGGQVIEWLDVETVWGSVASDSASDQLVSKAEQADRRYTIRIRYREDLTSDNRFWWVSQDKALYPQPPVGVGERKRQLIEMAALLQEMPGSDQ